ncbi:hypothetical protein [Alkalihalobacillus trypoxylicola]|uniref:Lipoprotein n=1 Tax=Alkalihalobacillus trypoxylicola TaxID=519424 RepID=A0A161PVJ4_9BACI|nr:hypothetical protein [Alkalihalobacillus trypoxylicola]KYG25577.1 hypothetical protein AZF04_13905 [Alkalihalobacillus trypoxylicola]
MKNIRLYILFFIGLFVVISCSTNDTRNNNNQESPFSTIDQKEQDYGDEEHVQIFKREEIDTGLIIRATTLMTEERELIDAAEELNEPHKAFTKVYFHTPNPAQQGLGDMFMLILFGNTEQGKKEMDIPEDQDYRIVLTAD